MSKKIKKIKEESLTPAYMKNTLGSRIFDSVNIFILCLITLTCIIPVWYTLCVSLSSKAMVEAGLVTFWPKEFTLTSYETIMNEKSFFVAFGVSLKRVVLGTIVTLFTIILMAYPLSKSKKEFPVRNIIMWLLVFCMLFNGGLVPWFMTMTKLNLTDNIWGLVLGSGIPVFNVILVINFFRNIPKQMEEAAVVDGAGAWTILFKIFLPVSKPVIATVTLFTAVTYWNEFFHGLVLSTNSVNYPLQTYIQQMVVNVNTVSLSVEDLIRLSTLSNQTLNSAKLFIAILPVLVIYPFLQKYFVTGITLGSVKE